MSISVSGATSTNLATPTPAELAAMKQLRTASIAGSSRLEDTVQISAATQAALMHGSGEGVESIASSLGTGAATIDAYLGVTATQVLPSPMVPKAHSTATTPHELDLTY
jgi:hypothetical protein